MIDVGKIHKNLLSFLTKLSFAMVYFAFATALQAGTTGKIKGNINDKQTGEALSGVNVQVVGTTLGAATDLDGFYIILNIPPGIYTLEVSYIGYSTSIVEIQVNVDLTTTQNFNISEETIRLDDIVVYAERPAVEMDRTNSVASMNAEQIDEDINVEFLL